MINLKYFGTDGIRGIVNEDLTTELLNKIGKAISVLKIKKIYIGYDTRESKYLMLYSLVSGLLSKGIDVIDSGLVSTPAMQYFSFKNKETVLMITASHNPYYYNGIKIFIDGYKLDKKEEEKIEYYIDNINDDNESGIGQYYKNNDIMDTYLSFLKTIKEPSKYKIKLDLANGALIDIANNLFEGDPNIQIINNNANGININDNCGSLYIENIDLDEYDYLFSFDGDGDRVLFKDKYQVYDGDLIVYLLAKYYINKNKKIDKVVLTKNVNLGLLKAFKKLRVNVLLSDIGDKNVYDLMIKENCLIGGEASGHIINLEYMISGDGLLNYILLSKILNEINMDEYLKNIEYYPFVNIDLDNDYSFEYLEEIQKKYQKKARINIRRSGTEKKIRVNICSKKEIYIENIVKEIKEYEKFKN